jgi:phenylalanyl-tRNA synthetase alpha chain
MQDTFFIRQILIFCCVRTHHLCRCVTWKQTPIRTISPEGFFVMKPFHLVHIVFSIKLEGLYIDKDVSFAETNFVALYKEMFGKSKSVYVLLIFRLRNQVLNRYLGIKTETDYRYQRNRMVRNWWLWYGGSNVLKKHWFKKNTVVLLWNGNWKDCHA